MGSKATHQFRGHALHPVRTAVKQIKTILPQTNRGPAKIPNTSTRTAGRPSEVPPPPGARRKAR